MHSLFTQDAYEVVMERIDYLSPQAKPQWGKMEVAQMLAHCKEAFKVPLSESPKPRVFLGKLIGWMIKSKLYNDSPYGKGLPTAPDFIIKDPRNFEEERRELKELINKFYLAGPDGLTTHPHPFFGNFTAEQWGKSMYKHLDHHLTQFAA